MCAFFNVKGDELRRAHLPFIVKRDAHRKVHLPFMLKRGMHKKACLPFIIKQKVHRKARLPFIIKRDARRHARLLLPSPDPKILSNIALSWIEYRASLHATVTHATYSFYQGRRVPLLLSPLKLSASRAFTLLLPQIECVICLGPFEDADLLYLLLRRHHGFHLGRINRWLKFNATCPLFRASVDFYDASARIIFEGGDEQMTTPMLLQWGATGTSSPLLSQIPGVGVSSMHEDPVVRWGSVACMWIRR
jgi:hypothetical protein